MTARASAELPAPFFDFAMSVLFVFMALFVLSTMDTPRPAAGVLTPKAEFLVEMTWDNGSASDVDLYAKGPDGKVIVEEPKVKEGDEQQPQPDMDDFPGE